MSDAAVVSIVSGVITIVGMIVGFLTMWIKLKTTGVKIDGNTELTRTGTETAVVNAKLAARAANTAAEKAHATENKLTNLMNGELDERIRSIVKEHFDPLGAAVCAHAEQDDKNMKEIRHALSELRDRIKL